eukprot:gnl/TRDRNA2_/TRDRNA2_59181_c0_seq1.p2 gnl/TRDRNA2_/TRDRNA2_59181_c0~~gnl/TRDRNA2_/TRDRNA2_59181_c0_seq1.p2  ORF type:complete len:131 (+),score=25.79 gnl/TRDRNA2_/TRDRNA2_59181_c0_seq1:120-512(+)
MSFEPSTLEPPADVDATTGFDSRMSSFDSEDGGEDCSEDGRHFLAHFGALFPPPPPECDAPDCPGPDPDELWLDDESDPKDLGTVLDGIAGLGLLAVLIGTWWLVSVKVTTALTTYPPRWHWRGWWSGAA